MMSKLVHMSAVSSEGHNGTLCSVQLLVIVPTGELKRRRWKIIASAIDGVDRVKKDLMNKKGYSSI